MACTRVNSKQFYWKIWNEKKTVSNKQMQKKINIQVGLQEMGDEGGGYLWSRFIRRRTVTSETGL